MRILFSVILLFGSILLGQASGVGKGSFSETGFFIKNFHADWNPHRLENNISFNFDLGEFKFGFKDFTLSYVDAVDDQYVNLEFSGPNLQLTRFSLNVKMLARDWIKSERIKRLERLQSIPNSALLTLANAIDLYWEDHERYPRSYDELAIKNYIDGSVNGVSEKYQDVFDPSKGEKIGEVILSNKNDFDKIIDFNEQECLN